MRDGKESTEEERACHLSTDRAWFSWMLLLVVLFVSKARSSKSETFRPVSFHSSGFRHFEPISHLSAELPRVVGARSSQQLSARRALSDSSTLLLNDGKRLQHGDVRTSLDCKKRTHLSPLSGLTFHSLPILPMKHEWVHEEQLLNKYDDMILKRLMSSA